MDRPTKEQVEAIAVQLDDVGMIVAAQCIRRQEWQHLPSIIRTMRDVTSLQTDNGKAVLARVEELEKHIGGAS